MQFKFLAGVALAAFITTNASSQHVDSYSNTRSEILHIQTALNHLTVIEVSEPVVSVAAGSPAFKIEWRENKVFVQPTEGNVATNLFIWTATQRFNYELGAAGPVEKMDFAVDQSPVPMPHPAPVAAEPPGPPSQMLLAGHPIRMDSKNRNNRAIEVTLLEQYEANGRLFVRYSLRNQGSGTYRATAPQVYALNRARYPQSLYSLVDSQLNEEQIHHLKINEQVPLETVNNQLSATTLSPGQEVIGVIAVQAPQRSGPTVLRLQFAPSNNDEVSAFFVR